MKGESSFGEVRRSLSPNHHSASVSYEESSRVLRMPQPSLIQPVGESELPVR